MRIGTTAPRAAALAHAVFPMAAAMASPPRRHRSLRRAAEASGDALALIALVVSIPFVILAVGTPLALAVKAVLWLVGAAN